MSPVPVQPEVSVGTARCLEAAGALEHRHLTILLAMMDEVQSYFMHDLEGGIAAHAEHPEAWAYVGMNVEWALAQLSFVRGCFPATAAPSFIDCGAGLGFVAMLARGLGFRPGGIELCSRYVALAERLFPWAQTFEGNVLTYPHYADHDVIFYYGPFKDEGLQARFEHKVEAEAKPGAIIIANRKVSEEWRSSSQFRLLKEDGVGSWIFQKC